jgi:Holliday junction resolvase
MAENQIEKSVVALAEKAGWFVRKLEWQGNRNAPDRIFIKGGRVVFIEFKDRGEEARLTQEDEIADMVAHGAEVHVCDGIGKACRVLGIPFVVDPLRPHY